MCLVPSRPSIETTEGQTHKPSSDGPTGAKQKSRNAETQDPPSQDPGGRKDHPPEQAKQDLANSQALLAGAEAYFRAASSQERAQRPSLVDPLDGTIVDFKRSLVRLAYVATRF